MTQQEQDARNSALEEAAHVAQCYHDCCEVGFDARTAGLIMNAIRALKTAPGSKTE